MRITIQSNMGDAIAQMQAITDASQLRFALARALTVTAADIQQEVRRNIPGRFNLRRQWIVQGIRIDRATKANLEARVYSRDDFMRLQETGGDKTPRGNYVAVPTKLVRRTAKDIIRKADRPRALGDRAEVVDFKGNKFLALKRPRKGNGDQRLRFLYLLVPRADIDQRLKLREDGVRIARERFGQNLQASIDLAMRTARR
jgi:hypothetical protein